MAAKKKRGPAPGTGGRPRIEDRRPDFWRELDAMLHIQCTDIEICSVFNCDRDTLNAACKRVHGVTFSAYSLEKRDVGKMSLRRAQWNKAVREGNPTMLIWLGKNLLSQTDKVEQDFRSSDGSMSPPNAIEIVAVDPDADKQ